ncbi:MAG: MCE family protein [Actinomycetota bacterium]
MIGSLRWSSVKLVIFTAFTVAVTVWLAAVIGNLRLFSSPYSVTAEFSDATGLLAGDAVRAAGVTIGRVDSIRIRDGLAVVTLSIDEGVELPAGVEAEIRFRNLIGQRMVTLTEPDASDGVLRPGDLIPLDRTAPAFDLTALFNGLRPLVRSTSPHDINIVTSEVTKALRGRSGQVESLLSNVAAVSDTLASKDRELSALLDGFNAVTDELAAHDTELSSGLESMATLLRDLAASKQDLSDALVVLDDAATRLRRVVADNDEHIESVVGDLAILLDAIDDKRKELKGALRALPSMLVSVERVTTYGQWANIHLVHACKDDLGACGTRSGR